MSDLKKMYTTMVEDPFPAELAIRLGDAELTFAKRTWTIDGEEKGLRYGENPDQPAALYAPVDGRLTLGGVTFRGPGDGLVCAATEEHLLQSGKHPGKTNLTDVDNGVNILQYLTAKPAAVILKHNNPCGAAWSDAGLAVAFEAAFTADRIAAFGGAVVVNRTLDVATAEQINAVYVEVVAAPDYEPKALEILKSKKNLRIFRLPGLSQLDKLVGQPFLDVKSLADGGLVLQFSFRNRILAVGDFLPAQATDKAGTTVVARAPSAQEAEDLLFAWAVEAGVTSNSVIFVKDGATVAIGTGEQDRVGVVELTIHKAKTKYADGLAFAAHKLSLYELAQKAKGDPEIRKSLADITARTDATNGGLAGTVLVSDGFFPFRDGVDLCIAAGVTAIAQPGGSIRDTEVIAACNEATPQVAMVFTGQRSFRH
ncbi:Phosphoribosylaminoimidazolecarboxamide formyltransferase [Solidesulfovibrio carbinoliphilus subsp. oakridgensis]|uniref:Phosphoribosylaminoimidazolecarboxamide formyltransferase n=1 Tax=Solidesulfovibrio carbinoliphilus subsp. oakridgensis TaxID=694327 RepID=G7QA84_9BACT|nr:phosphoribosylaminoimidazolecarboxamide formyltransferase [Solidesulfovibrio carbinoliphilus]EHJ48235.1 Phosphoribosylaminoimidazolecarboxamide formyltransferase [Solidesulfovibrio carbinoliphilus subsp. oakridgensis]